MAVAKSPASEVQDVNPGEIVQTGITAVKLGAAAGATIPFTALARRMLGPAADEVAEMLRDSIRVYRYQRQLRLLQKAEKMAANAGFTPQAVPLKLLFPLLEGASLEEDEDIHTMWAALLANASLPSSLNLVLPSFAEVLRVLTPEEARLLNAAYKYALSQAEPAERTPASQLGILPDPEGDLIHDPFAKTERMKRLTQIEQGTYSDIFRLFLESGCTTGGDTLVTSATDSQTAGRDAEIRYQFEVAFEELQRLQMWNGNGASRERYYLSAFGCQFITVCNAPEVRKP
jgi:Abortive infection alpha